MINKLRLQGYELKTHLELANIYIGNYKANINILMSKDYIIGQLSEAEIRRIINYRIKDLSPDLHIIIDEKGGRTNAE